MVIRREVLKPSTPKALGTVKLVTTGPTYTVVDSDQIIHADDDAAGVQITILLPPAVSHKNRRLTVKKIGSTANVVVDGNGAETVDESATQTIDTQFHAISLICNGTAWTIFSNVTALSGDTDTQNTLDQAYDEGGAGVGRTITADTGSVKIDGSNNVALEVSQATASNDALFVNQNVDGVGINIDSEATGSPLLTLDAVDANARGDIAFGTVRTSDAASPSEGDVWYNATSNNLLLYDGSGNVDLTQQNTDNNTQNTLDEAYDEGGSGSGRTITADSGAVQITGSAQALLDVDQSGNFVGIDIVKTGAGAGAALSVENDGTGDGVFINQDGAGIALNVDQDGAAIAIQVNQATDNAAVVVTQAGDAVGVSINKTGTVAGTVLDVVNAGTGVGISLDNNGNSVGLGINQSSSASTAGNSALIVVGENSRPVIGILSSVTAGIGIAITQVTTGAAIYSLSTSTGNACFLDQNGNSTALVIDSEATSAALITLSALNANTNGDISFSLARTGDPSSPIEGEMWYNKTSNVMKYYDGTTVQTF